MVRDRSIRGSLIVLVVVLLLAFSSTPFVRNFEYEGRIIGDALRKKTLLGVPTKETLAAQIDDIHFRRDRKDALTVYQFNPFGAVE